MKDLQWEIIDEDLQMYRAMDDDGAYGAIIDETFQIIETYTFDTIEFDDRCNECIYGKNISNVHPYGMETAVEHLFDCECPSAKKCPILIDNYEHMFE